MTIDDGLTSELPKNIIIEKGAPLKNKGLTVITTHVNADYDALASLLAAQKIYPDSLIVFPVSREKSLRDFFIQTVVYLFNLADVEDIDIKKIKKLVLVDTRQPGRIGRLAEALENPGIEIHIYDHHPVMTGDIIGHREYSRNTGATITLLVNLLKEKKISLTPDESTVMCLGLFEDTGSFTFSSTTPADFKAAAWFLAKGADLNIISNMLSREMTPRQVSVLNDLIQEGREYNFNGVDVCISTISTDEYVPDMAFLVHKMVKMENINVIVAIAGMENTVYVVARSRIPEVDVSAIVKPLGGGGHTFAAAASVKNKPLAEVESSVIELLHKKIRSNRQARDLMSSPPIRIDADLTIKEAKNVLTRYNINALLVTDEFMGLYGFISRQVIEKATYHHLDEIPVIEYMTTEMATVGPEADLLEIQDKIFENNQRVLPVVENEEVIGVITRTDLLKAMVLSSRKNGELTKEPLLQTAGAKTRNITRFMNERLSNKILKILAIIRETSAETKMNSYVIGGFVRDLFLFRHNEDIDIVVEGEGIVFAKAFCNKIKGRVNTHEKFGTAVVIFQDGFKIDVASARLEYYKFPAALPTVEMSSVKLDLFRRDFTVNTLAIKLAGEDFGTLIDFFTAQKDIKEKAIRVLHNLSFVEDPTRVFRAIRFEQRFGFTIGKLTKKLIENSVKMDFFKRLSGRRVFAELKLILEEENPIPAIKRMNDFNLLVEIHEDIFLDKSLVESLEAVRKALSWFDLLFLENSYIKWIVYFMVLTRQSMENTLESVLKRFEIAPKYAKIILEERFSADKKLAWLVRSSNASNSTIYKSLSSFKTETILYMMAVGGNDSTRRMISKFITRLRYVKPQLRGNDLKKMGLQPGPKYKEILDAILMEKLNGNLSTLKQEIEYAKRYAK